MSCSLRESFSLGRTGNNVILNQKGNYFQRTNRVIGVNRKFFRLSNQKDSNVVRFNQCSETEKRIRILSLRPSFRMKPIKKCDNTFNTVPLIKPIINNKNRLTIKGRKQDYVLSFSIERISQMTSNQCTHDIQCKEDDIHNMYMCLP